MGTQAYGRSSDLDHSTGAARLRARDRAAMSFARLGWVMLVGFAAGVLARLGCS